MPVCWSAACLKKVMLLSLRWPGVVSPDPWSDGDYISEYREVCIYHVEFLGKMRTHSWVPEEQVEPYHCQSLCSLGEVRKSRRFDYALTEADSYATLSDSERLSKCEYTEDAVKVEDTKPHVQTQAQNSASNPNQNAQVGRPISSTTGNKKGRPSKAAALQAKSSHPLRDMTNNSASSAAASLGAAVSQITTAGAHEDLFKTLGMGFNERNHINLVANTLIQQIQAQVLAALDQHVTTLTATTTNTEQPQCKATASAQRATASTEQSTTSVRTSLKSSLPSMTVAGTCTKAGPSSTNIPPQSVSPTSLRLTQTSLELSPDNQVKLVMTKQAPRRCKKVNHRQTLSGKEKAKRKCRSPLAQAGGGKRTKRRGGGVDFVSPTIRDYFKTSDKAANEPLKGTPQLLIAKDQEVPIVPTSSSSAAVAANSTFKFQSLEMEAESELLEIQTMLSMFDDIPATSTTSSKIDKPCLQNTYPTTKTALDVQGHQLQGQVSDREQSLIVTDNHRDCGGTVATGDDMDIESILQEMNTIDDLLRDLSQAQVVPY